MTQPTNHDHCAFCAYHNAAGTLTIHTTAGPRHHRTCRTCAHEAADYYPARHGFPVSFQPDRKP